MTMVINGSGTITGLSAGGLPDASVSDSDLASGAAVSNIGTGGITLNELATAVKPLGVGQTWQNMTGSRSTGTTYTNSTGRPIMVCVLLATANLANGSGSLNVNGLAVAPMNCYVNASTPPRYAMTVVVPSGSTYSASVSSSSLSSWYELR